MSPPRLRRTGGGCAGGLVEDIAAGWTMSPTKGYLDRHPTTPLRTPLEREPLGKSSRSRGAETVVLRNLSDPGRPEPAATAGSRLRCAHPQEEMLQALPGRVLPDQQGVALRSPPAIDSYSETSSRPRSDVKQMAGCSSIVGESVTMPPQGRERGLPQARIGSESHGTKGDELQLEKVQEELRSFRPDGQHQALFDYLRVNPTNQLGALVRRFLPEGMSTAERQEAAWELARLLLAPSDEDLRRWKDGLQALPSTGKDDPEDRILQAATIAALAG